MTVPPAILDYRSPRPRKSGIGKIVKWVIAVALVLLFLLLLMPRKQSNTTEIPYSTFDTELNKSRVVKIVIGADDVYGTFSGNGVMLADGKLVTLFQTRTITDAAKNWEFVQYLRQRAPNAEISFESNDNLVEQILVPLIPWLLIFGFIWFFVSRLRHGPRRPLPVYHVPPPVTELGAQEQ